MISKTLLPVALATLVAASGVSASPATGSFRDIPALKAAYLRCEHAAQTGALASDAVASCSEIYYRLKDEAFDGQFAKIREWYELVLTARGLAAFQDTAIYPARELLSCN